MNTVSLRMRFIAPAILRWGMAGVFLWFGTQQLLHTANWVGFVPAWVIAVSPLSATDLVHANGVFEIIFGLALLVGFHVRFVSFFLTLHMFQIAASLGYSAIAIRDFGLAIASLAIFLFGADSLTLDGRNKTSSIENL